MSGCPISFVMACTCGHQAECEAQDQRVGRVWECPACGKITVRLIRKRGDTMWVPLDREMAKQPYYDLLRPPEPEDPDDPD